MADNTTLNAGTGGDVIRDRDRSGVKTPIVAFDLNPAGSETLMAGSMPSSGDVAHDGVDSGSPVKTGGRAIAFGSSPTSVASADRTDALFTRHGQQFVIGGHPNIVSTRVNYTGAQTDAVIGPTNATGTRMMVTQIQVTADNANTAYPAVRIGFGATNTPTGDGVVWSHPGIPAGGGGVRGSGAAVIGAGGDGEELRITCAVPGGSIDVVVSYFLIS